MIMNDATASACRELIARGRGENHNPTGTAIVKTPPIILPLAGALPTLSTRGAARTVCSVVRTTELVLQWFSLVRAEAGSCCLFCLPTIGIRSWIFLREELWHQKAQNSIPHAIRHVNFPIFRVQRQTYGVNQAAKRTADHRQRRHVAIVRNVPDTHET